MSCNDFLKFIMVVFHSCSSADSGDDDDGDDVVGDDGDDDGWSS